MGAYLLRNALASLDKDRKGQMLKQQLDQLKVSYVQIDVSSLMGPEFRRDAPTHGSRPQHLLALGQRCSLPRHTRDPTQE